MIILHLLSATNLEMRHLSAAIPLRHGLLHLTGTVGG